MVNQTEYSYVNIKTPEGVFTFPFNLKFLELGVGDAIKLNNNVYCFDGHGSETVNAGTSLLNLSTQMFDDFMRPRRTKSAKPNQTPSYVTVHKLEELLSN